MDLFSGIFHHITAFITSSNVSVMGSDATPCRTSSLLTLNVTVNQRLCVCVTYCTAALDLFVSPGPSGADGAAVIYRSSGRTKHIHKHHNKSRCRAAELQSCSLLQLLGCFLSHTSCQELKCALKRCFRSDDTNVSESELPM